MGEDKNDNLEDDFMKRVTESIASKVDEELTDGDQNVQNDLDNEKQTSTKKRRFPIWAKILLCILLLMVIGVGAYACNVLSNIKRVNQNEIVLQEETFEKDEDEDDSSREELDPNDVNFVKDTSDIKKVKGVTNILLLGEERVKGEKRGRTDSIMIATINTNDNSLKLTTLMRDLYVQIPGYKDNRINAAYQTGDYPLLIETIKENFNLEVQGYIKVDYAGFAGIIDALGGVEITLTESEASYLNRTNYIAEKKYRNVKVGTQTLNGAQALGYSRVRKVKTGANELNDFGRTARQRTVLTAIFNKYKTADITTILKLLPKITSLITTDISNTDLISYASTALSLNVSELQTLSIPVSNSYKDVKIRSMRVLVPDLQKNINAIDEFIYGKE